MLSGLDTSDQLQATKVTILLFIFQALDKIIEMVSVSDKRCLKLNNEVSYLFVYSPVCMSVFSYVNWK